MFTKGQNIWKKRLETKSRHKSMSCKVYELKILKSRLNRGQLNHIKMIFVEAKWVYNYVLSLQKNGIDIFKIKYNNYSSIKHFDKNRIEVEELLKYLSSQMKQELFQATKRSIINLSKSKKVGNKIGSLRFKSEVNSIPLSQYGITYKLFHEFNKVKIQGIKKSISVRGIHQIPTDSEISNANLIQKPSGYYLKVTTFRKPIEKIKTGKSIGLDFGIKNQITDSNGNTFNWNFQESKRLKKLSKNLSKKIEGSNNRYKIQKQLEKEYERLTNRKKDVTKKFVSKSMKENDFVCIQDETIHEWKSSNHKGWSMKIHHSIIGAIKADLQRRSATLIVDRWKPTTKTCSRCGSIKDMPLGQSLYECPKCHLVIDRDKNSAINILHEGLKMIEVPTDYREFKLVENGMNCSMKQENAAIKVA